MSRPGAAAIGAFVLGALALAAAALVFFFGGALRDKPLAVVSFFEGSVAGLRVGAPVTFQGVPVGEVKALGVRVDPRTGRSIIQVSMLLAPERVTVHGAAKPPRETLLASLVHEGLTAQLVGQSLVTGLLGVELAFRPGAEVSRFGDSALPEIPTVPGELDALRKQLQAVDMASALQSVERTLGAVDALLRHRGLNDALERLPATLAAAERAFGSVEREVGSASHALQGTLANADALIDDARALVGPHSATAMHAQRAVEDLAVSAARLRNLAERIDRDPSVLVRGR